MDMTEAFQLMPEQSTAAIIIHHPEAKYFAVRGAQAPATTNEDVALDRAAAGDVSLAEARADT
jgi:hypothetical protein